MIDFPMVQDLASLLWVVNLGCIDLNPWYARCDDVDRPDYLHFDLDPVPEATYAAVRRDGAARARRPRRPRHGADREDDRLARPARLRARSCAGRRRRQVWTLRQALRARRSPRCDPKLVTAEYRIAKRPAGRVLVDYNQNAWGRTLASAYSPRPRPLATVSAPITLGRARGRRAHRGLRPLNMPARIAAVGDLWAPLLAARDASISRRCSARSAEPRSAGDGRVAAEQLVERREQLLELDRLDEVLVEAGVAARAARSASRP